MRPTVLCMLLLLPALSGCQGSTELYVREVETWDGTPLVVEPDHVQAEAPVLHDLLERAHKTGWAGTSDLEERRAVLDYLHERTGDNENRHLIQYRDKVFEQGLNVS